MDINDSGRQHTRRQLLLGAAGLAAMGTVVLGAGVSAHAAPMPSAAAIRASRAVHPAGRGLHPPTLGGPISIVTARWSE